MKKLVELTEEITINGYEFNLNGEPNDDDRYYQCRGDMYYDDEHDEMPEPGLWSAALKLVKILEKDGYETTREHSEKGWVEVQIR